LNYIKTSDYYFVVWCNILLLKLDYLDVFITSLAPGAARPHAAPFSAVFCLAAHLDLDVVDNKLKKINHTV